MQEEKSDANVPADLTISQPPGGPATPSSESPLKGQGGAVLLRIPPRPVPGAARPRPAAWSVERPRPIPSNVDIADKSRSRPPMAAPSATSTASATSSNVDIRERPRPQPVRRSPPSPLRFVDSPETAPVSGNVDTADAIRGMPSPVQDSIRPEEQNAPGQIVPRTGPDEGRVRSVVEARKRVLRDRAAARGRDPNAGAFVSPVSSHLTRSAKTHEGYLKTGERLMKRYRRSAELTNVPVDAIDPVDFVNYCFSIKPTITPSAWRSYKPGIRSMLDSLPHERADEAIRMLNGDISETVESAKESAPRKDGTGRKLPRRTSASKEKRFPKEAFDFITTYLKYISRSKLAPILVDWMVAGLATGLRPIEWAATDLQINEDPTHPKGRVIYLYVLNAKATNGKGNGLVRTLDLTHCRDETIAAVKRMSNYGYEWLNEGIYDDMQRQCSQVLYKACDMLSTIKGKTYALYSLRHQFVANQKSIHPQEYVSAMCGHIVVDTAVSNYGKKTSAWDPEDIADHVAPVEDEVALIQPRFTYFKQQAELRQAAGLAPLSPGSND